MPRPPCPPLERLNTSASRYTSSREYEPPSPTEVDDEAEDRAQAWTQWSKIQLQNHILASMEGQSIGPADRPEETPGSESDISWVWEVNPTLVALAEERNEREESVRRQIESEDNGSGVEASAGNAFAEASRREQLPMDWGRCRAASRTTESDSDSTLSLPPSLNHVVGVPRIPGGANVSGGEAQQELALPSRRTNGTVDGPRASEEIERTYPVQHVNRATFQPHRFQSHTDNYLAPRVRTGQMVSDSREKSRRERMPGHRPSVIFRSDRSTGSASLTWDYSRVRDRKRKHEDNAQHRDHSFRGQSPFRREDYRRERY